MPTQISETEEFEFRARAEAEAGLSVAPPKEIPKQGATAPSDADIRAANIKASQEEHGPVEDVISNIKGIGTGAASALEGIGNTIEHPIDAASSFVRGIPGTVKTVGQMAMHPINTAKSVAQGVKGLTPQKVGEMEGSALVGGAAGKAAGVLGDVVGPSIKELIGGEGASPAIRELAEKGIVTTPGMRAGPKSFMGSAEQKLESLAGGQSITNRRMEAVVKWSAQKLDDALKDLGKGPVPANKAGRDALFYTKNEISNGYNTLLPKLQGDLHKVANGSSLSTDLDQIRTAATAKGTGIRPTDRAHLVSVIDNDVLDRFKGGGKADGKTLKSIQDVLDKEIKAYGAGNVSERKVADHLKDVKGKLWDMVRRENPQYAADLKKLDTAYAKFQTAALASRIGGKGQAGAFTPNQYLRSIERRDKSKDKGRFATGTAYGQKEAESASKIMGNTVPDSGTPGRQQLIEMLKNPFGSIGGIAVNAATPIAYSKPVQKFLQNRALKKGGPYQPIGGKKAAAAGALLAQPGQPDQNGIVQ